MSFADVLEEIDEALFECRQYFDSVDADVMDYIVLKLDCCDENLRWYISSTSPQLPEYSTLRELHYCINELQMYCLLKSNNTRPSEGRPKKVVNVELVSIIFI